MSDKERDGYVTKLVQNCNIYIKYVYNIHDMILDIIFAIFDIYMSIFISGVQGGVQKP